MHTIEVRESGTSITPGKCVIIAQGDVFTLSALFPVIVASAVERGYEMVALYGDNWDSLASWSWKGAGNLLA